MKPQAIATLQHEHRYFESVLTVLDQQAAKATSGDCDYPLLRDIMHYLISYPDAYHHPREDRVFERLLELDPGSRVAVQGLINGHKTMYRETRRLQKLVDRPADADGGDECELQQAISRYTESYRNHMRTEDSVIFPRAIEKLSDKDWEAVSQAYRQDQDPLFGDMVKRRYRRLAEDLYERAELVRRRFAVAELLGIESAVEGIATVSAAALGIGQVVAGRTRQGLNENLESVRRRCQSGNVADIVNVPTDIMRNNWRHMDKGVREIGEILGQAAEDIRRPYSTRMDYLKDLLRRDWDS